ncbi:hypothetical protein MS3_00004061 [Schistosoma haematobium]|uniref:Uncharacterized protein n=1 Tax=Schistosoma haematobium TaxID=6185 RepID=A0A922S3P5_SCHHA|nr:hypothetical protein MS3_00004061 [Schistosoma haematobium]KAH9591980.1 hypothetical protein MS3_00004061 [Schistosoma haematobium]
MTILPDQLKLLLDRQQQQQQQQQRFRESQLNVLDYLRTRLLNLPCFGDVKEIDELISHLHTELENDCRTYEYENKSLYESLMISNANEAVAHDPSSDPELSNSEACPVVGSNPTVPETCEVSSLQEEPLVPENVSRASNNGQKSNTNFKDAVYFSDLLSTDGILKRSDEYVSQESNLNDLISSVAGPHHLISFSEPSTQCAKYALNRIRLTVTWVYEDPTLFRGGGRTKKILKSGY